MRARTGANYESRTSGLSDAVSAISLTRSNQLFLLFLEQTIAFTYSTRRTLKLCTFSIIDMDCKLRYDRREKSQCCYLMIKDGLLLLLLLDNRRPSQPLNGRHCFARRVILNCDRPSLASSQHCFSRQVNLSKSPAD